MQGALNPQNKYVSAFVQKALDAAASEGQIAHIENYGHSTGASNAMLSNAILDAQYPNLSEAILVEPFKAAQCKQTILANQAQLNLKAPITDAALDKNTHSRMAARNKDGKLSRFPLAAMFLGDGIGEQALVDMGQDSGDGLQQAINDHKAFSIAQAQERGAASANTNTGTQQAPVSGNSIEDFIMGILQNLLTEIFSMVQSVQATPPAPAPAGLAGKDIPSLSATGVSLTDPNKPSAATVGRKQAAHRCDRVLPGQ